MSVGSALTPAQIITTFESLIDDTLDSVLEYNLLNQVKDTLEAKRFWAFLTKVDASQSANAGDTYLTMKTLPSDFILQSEKGIYVGTDIIPYIIVPFVSRPRWQSISHRYYIDLFNNQYAIMGNPNPGGTINFFYQSGSPSLASGGANWVFPPRFHMILPFLMAIKYYAIDQGEKSRAYDDRWENFAKEIFENMVAWDMQIKKQAIENDRIGADLSTYPNIVDIDQSPGGGLFA